MSPLAYHLTISKTGLVAILQMKPRSRCGAISLNRVEGTLSKYKDHSGLCELGSGIAQLAGRDLSNPAFCDSRYEVAGNDISLGYTLALHAEPVSGTRLALVYHSAVRYTLTGDSEITNTPITAATAGNTPGLIAVAPGLPLVDASTGRFAARDFLSEKSRLALTTPASLAFSVDQQLSAQWSLQASVSWTGWSKFRSIDIISTDANPSISLGTSSSLQSEGYIGYIPEYWHDSYAAALGATYQMNPDLTLAWPMMKIRFPVRIKRLVFQPQIVCGSVLA
jgi:long-chain fatty acid transport protein